MFIYWNCARYRTLASLKEAEKNQLRRRGACVGTGEPLPSRFRGGVATPLHIFISHTYHKTQQLILDLANPEDYRAEFYQESGSL